MTAYDQRGFAEGLYALNVFMDICCSSCSVYSMLLLVEINLRTFSYTSKLLYVEVKETNSFHRRLGPIHTGCNQFMARVSR